MPLGSLQLQLADLYYRSGSARFDGPFEFSVHRDNPKLEKSPSYLHYPKPGESGAERLPELYELAAKLMNQLIDSTHPIIEFERIAAVPSGALPLAASLAGRRSQTDRLLTFTKNDQVVDGSVFSYSAGRFNPGDRVLIIDDHTSGGRNKRLIKKAIESLGLVVADMITVVNRQQGGVEAMAAAGVRLHALLTLDDILDHGVKEQYIDAATADLTRGYVRRNQLG